jgi:hypothetical protein
MKTQNWILTILIMVSLDMVMSACTAIRKPLSSPPTAFVAVYESEVGIKDRHQQKIHLQQTFESDGNGHMRWSNNQVPPRQWQFRNYKNQSMYAVNDPQKIFYLLPAPLGGVFLIDEPSAVAAASPSLKCNIRLVGTEIMDGHTCKHYIGSLQHPLEDERTPFDVWYSDELHCAIKTQGLARDAHLISYKQVPRSLIEIPKNYRAVDVYTFNKASGDPK